MNARTATFGAAGLAFLVGLAMLPALLSASSAATSGACGAVLGGPVEVIAATIRQLESGGAYTARASGSSASGAYGFLDSSWAGYGGYPSAWMAPPHVQDAKAVESITAVLSEHGNDVTAVPVAWYIGHVPAPGSPEWDIVPAPGSGNRLTPRQYQARWMEVYRAKLAEHTGSPSIVSVTGEVAPLVECDTAGQAAVLAGGWALPGPRELIDSDPGQLDDPHHDYPAWDWGIPVGTPVYAMRGGTVVSITTTPYNCAGQQVCNPCGLGVTVSDEQGVRWTYCHGSRHHVNQGDQIAAGQQILSSGNTGNSTGPHLHLSITTGGVGRCPQPLLVSLYARGVGLDPYSLPTSGCTY